MTVPLQAPFSPGFNISLQTLCHFMNWSEFFNMGGYARYVWPAYGLMALVLALNVVLPLRRRTEVLAKIRRLRAQAEKKA
jgi:heme exporter protein D